MPADGAVGLREPCPCGSGRRFKSCHGSGRAHAAPFVARPFEGLPDETEWVALRELVPAGTATLRLREPGPPVTLATVLPLAAPVLVRSDGGVLLAAQVATSSDDPSRDMGAALASVLPGAPREARLQDLLAPAPLEVQVHQDFAFWTAPGEDPGPEVAASRERADTLAVPTARLTSVASAYWCRIGERSHLRWVLPEAEDPLLDALARMGAAQLLALVPGSRFVGSLRMHGLLVPVWDLPPTVEATALEEPAAAFRARLDELLADERPLRDDERRARAGLLNRQLTLR